MKGSKERPIAQLGLALAMGAVVSAPDASGAWTSWPPQYRSSNDTELGMSLKYQFDVDRFAHDQGVYDDAQTNRRKELGLYVRQSGSFDATAVFDFQAKAWLDVYARLQTRTVFGQDAGAIRAGFMKTPVGLEGNTGTGSTSFLEAALPTQAIYASRRIGVDWVLARRAYLVQLGYYHGGTLQGDLDGRMVALRTVWIPRNTDADVIYLGWSVSREAPQGTIDGRGQYSPPSVRLRALPEAGLATQRLVDSGTLSVAKYVDRRGMEALWIDGPWSLQGELLTAKVKLVDRPGYHARGWYAFASWVITGQARTYKAGSVSDVPANGSWGAVELLVRYSRLDLDDDPTLGGTERDWTVGANWYITDNLKLQANYVWAASDRRDLRASPRIVEMRAQVMF